jgi:hypothetical protein
MLRQINPLLAHNDCTAVGPQTVSGFDAQTTSLAGLPVTSYPSSMSTVAPSLSVLLEESKRLRDLENTWNDKKHIPPQPRRQAQMTKDMKKFAYQSTGGNMHQAERTAVIKSLRAESSDIFGKMSSTFNFTHHDNTDPKAEMKVMKIILIREGHLMTLQSLSEKIARCVGGVSSYCTRVLEVLAEIRESTLNYLEALCLWRQTIPNGNTMSPRVFHWEKKNYTLKIVTDLDFLADNPVILGALKISAEQFRSNPLMLTNNLNDPDTWMDPVERATQDVGGQRNGPLYENRLKLRYAERILLQEIEINSEGNMERPSGYRPNGIHCSCLF